MNEKELELYKQKIKDVLRFFDDFCREYNLRYFAACGTAIGVVRHKGFIPWDDDVDVYMLREDYNRLLSLRSQLKDQRYQIVTLGDKGYIYPFAKMIDTHTTLLEDVNYPSCIIGAYIDIFALDSTDAEKDEVQKKRDKYMRLYNNHLSTYHRISLRYLASCIKHVKYKSFILSCIPLFAKNIIRKHFHNYEIELSKECGHYLYFHRADFPLSKELYPKEWFCNSYDEPFEDIKIKVNNNVEDYLKKLYGDYMVLPPVEERVPKHIHYYINLKERLTAQEIKKRIAKGEYSVY